MQANFTKTIKVRTYMHACHLLTSVHWREDRVSLKGSIIMISLQLDAIYSTAVDGDNYASGPAVC